MLDWETLDLTLIGRCEISVVVANSEGRVVKRLAQDEMGPYTRVVSFLNRSDLDALATILASAIPIKATLCLTLFHRQSPVLGLSVRIRHNHISIVILLFLLGTHVHS